MKKRSIILCIIVCMLSCLVYPIVKADSGWDSDYDSGSSWDSSDSWDSDYDSSFSAGGVTVSGDGAGVIFVIIVIVIIVIIIKNSRGGNNKGAGSSNNAKCNDMNRDDILKIDSSINIDEVKSRTFQIYKEVQEDWMNFNYDGLRKNLTDELYNLYESDLKTLKIKHQKNIMEDITMLDVGISNIRIENGVENIDVELSIKMKDYVVDKDNNVVRGNKNIYTYIKYRITFVKGIGAKNIDKCPSCGAKIDIVSGGKCPYCDSTVVNNNSSYVMSKKQSLIQWR